MKRQRKKFHIESENCKRLLFYWTTDLKYTYVYFVYFSVKVEGGKMRLSFLVLATMTLAEANVQKHNHCVS